MVFNKLGTHWRVLLIFLVPFILILTGCKEKLSYSYLIRHPNVLKQAVVNCQSLDEKAANEVEQCQIVMNAAADLILVINEQQEDPEKFGQQILTTEEVCVKAKEELQKTQQTLNAVKGKKILGSELQTAENNLIKAKKNYQEQHEKVSILLGVAGMNSPE